jgi:preprotein translocase SecF subunit
MMSFYGNRNKFFIFSATLFLVGVIAFFINGIKLDIQFQGGSILKYTYTQDINKEKAAEIATKTLNRKVDAQVVEDLAKKTKKIVLNVAGNQGVSAQDQEKLTTDLKAEFKESGLALDEALNVEPFIGKRFFLNGMWAMILASLIIMAYVWYRFKRIASLSLGVFALVALFHDIGMVLVTFIVFKIPLNDAFIAVVLTILGYSMNDTVVIYDRIRENARFMKQGTPVTELVDVSVNQSLTRSINTALMTFLSMLIVYVFALIYNI